MNELPSGWVNTTIGDVTTDVQQRVPQPAETFTYIDISSIDREAKRILNPQKLDGENAPSRARKVVKTNDVLVSMTRPNLNAVASVPAELNEQIASTGFDVLRATSIESRWLYYLVRSSAFVSAMSESVQGALYPAVRSKDVRGFEIALPPLNEQKRIADKLDEVLSRVDAYRAHLDRVPLMLKRFRKAVLAAAMSGRLTEEWRAERGGRGDVRSIEFDDDSVSVPYSWELYELNELIDPKRPLCYGVVQPGEEVEEGVSLIRVQDLDHWGVLANSLRTISTNVDTEYRRSRVEAGDLLISVVGTIGRTAIVPTGLKANIARAIARVACRDGVLSQWVNIWLSSGLLQWWLIKNSREVARKTLNLSELGTARIALPPLEEQREIVRRVEACFAYADRFEAYYKAARAYVD
jgi:type I restriction enzyme, S subunit